MHTKLHTLTYKACIALYGSVKSDLLVKFDTLMCSQILKRKWREVFPI